jgi:hypothetical protein
VVRVSDYWSLGPGFDSQFYHGNFPLEGRIPVVTMVWVVSRFKLKAPPGISPSYISPLTPSGQRNLWGPGFDSRFYHGNFPLEGRIPVVTMVWVVSRFKLKAPSVISPSYISPLTPSGQRNLWGPGFDSRFYPGNFPLDGRIPVVTVVWVVGRCRLKAPPGISSPYISPLTQRNCASWASQPQKSVTLSPQPGGKTIKFIRTCGGIGEKKRERLSYS